jgi:hypothetical protein
MNSRALWGFIAVFAAVTLLARVAPHVPNMAPVAAFALFIGVHARSRWAWLLVPVVLTLSNWIIGLYQPGVMAAVYGCFLLTVMIGVFARRYPRLAAVAGGSVAASTMFFVVTNLAVWASSGMYALTPEGLLLCYVLAVPFFGYTLVGDLVWNAVFFGSYGAFRRWTHRMLLRAPRAAEAAN